MFRNSTTIRVPLETLSEISKKISELAETNSSIFDVLCNSLTALEADGGWKGTSAASAIRSAQSSRKQYQKAVEDLNALAGYLADFARDMSEKDRELASSIQRI